MEDLDIIKEFLIESDENLVRLDQEIIELEKDPGNPDLIASIFRTIHTIKGTCGFLGFTTLTEVSHAAESILSQVRDGKRSATNRLINIILQAIDAIKQILGVIESTGTEGGAKYNDLVRKLQQFAETSDSNEPAPEPSFTEPVELTEVPETPVTAMLPETSAKVEEASAPSADTSAAKAAKSGKSAAGSVADTSIRVDVSLLDKLMNLVGELVLARNQVLQFSSRMENTGFNATSQRLNLITSELQENVMKTRMQPIGIVWSKFPRVVRDIAASVGKQITLTMEGSETELDRTIIEAIKDPLTHIVRNSCDHGIEKPEDRVAKGKPVVGKLAMRAFHEGGHVNIEISDDGAGLNPEKIKAKAVQKGLITAEQASRMTDREAACAIFLPGFSTAEQVSNISGRGVGMDVVKTNIERIGGAVDLLSGNGPGTTVKIKIPLTLAIIPGLVVTSGEERFVIPQVSLSELVRLEGDNGRRQLERMHGATFYRRRGRLLPVAFLSGVLEDSHISDDDVVNIVILQAEDREFGLVVDTINDTQEIVVKPLCKQLKGLTVYSGATIMGDGKVALILDVLGIAQRAGLIAEGASSHGQTADVESAKASDEIDSLLLFSAGPFERIAVPLSRVARLEEIPVSQVERAAGQLVAQYRGQILLMIPLVSCLDASEQYTLPEDQNIQVIVFTSGDRSVGLVVDRIIDIVQENITIRRDVRARGLLGSAVVGQKVTDLLDLEAVIHAAGEEWFARRDSEAEPSEEGDMLHSLEQLSALLEEESALVAQ